MESARNAGKFPVQELQESKHELYGNWKSLEYGCSKHVLSYRCKSLSCVGQLHQRRSVFFEPCVIDCKHCEGDTLSSYMPSTVLDIENITVN